MRNHHSQKSAIGLWLKSERNRGGLISDVLFENITMEGVAQVTRLSMQYHGGIPAGNASSTPHFRNVSYRDVAARNTRSDRTDQQTLYFHGLPESLLEGISLANVSISMEPGQHRPLAIHCEDTGSISVDAVTLDGEAVHLPDGGCR